jgi:hypothetical protein
MSKCSICGTEQKEIGECEISIVGSDLKPIPITQYNINIYTWIKGKGICDNCMDIYHKIYALKYDLDFSCDGNSYYADGRNLE